MFASHHDEFTGLDREIITFLGRHRMFESCTGGRGQRASRGVSFAEKFRIITDHPSIEYLIGRRIAMSVLLKGAREKMQCLIGVSPEGSVLAQAAAFAVAVEPVNFFGDGGVFPNIRTVFHRIFLPSFHHSSIRHRRGEEETEYWLVALDDTDISAVLASRDRLFYEGYPHDMPLLIFIETSDRYGKVFKRRGINEIIAVYSLPFILDFLLREGEELNAQSARLK
jgi:hypothetical protein